MSKLLLYLYMVLCTISILMAQEKNAEFSQIAPFEGEDRIIIHTSKGDILCRLYHKEAPLAVGFFIKSIIEGFYNGLTFYRIVPKHVIEAGDPGGPDHGIAAEIGQPHQRGALAWLRLPNYQNPEKLSSGSQFYITLGNLSNWDQEYSVFGHIIDGMDILDLLEEGDVIKNIIISSQNEN